MKDFDLTQERLAFAQDAFSQYNFGSSIESSQPWQEVFDTWTKDVLLVHPNPEYPSTKVTFEIIFSPSSVHIESSGAYDISSGDMVGYMPSKNSPAQSLTF